MKTLPKGITGFNCDGPFLEWSTIRKPIIASIFAAGEKVEREIPGNVGRNYHRVLTTGPTVLVNYCFKVLACSNTKDEHCLENSFVDWGALQSAIAYYPEWELLSSSFLTEPVTAELTKELGKHELSEMRHWGEKKIGNVIFNYRDKQNRHR